MEPFTATVHVVFAADGEDGMSEWWDRFDAALHAIPGTFSEGASMQSMHPDDLIPDSPLAQYLAAASNQVDRSRATESDESTSRAGADASSRMQPPSCRQGGTAPFGSEGP